MAVQTNDLTTLLREQILKFEPSASQVDVGEVVEIGDGIALVSGLRGAMAGELLEFTKNGILGIALNLNRDTVGIIIMGDYQDIEEGDLVRSTGRIASVPVGDAMIGRVVNAVGQPLDGKGPIDTDRFRNVERIAPGVILRQPVNTPVQTGITAIDALIPIGRGQRELIIGDRQTGKTADRAGHDHQPGGQGPDLHLRGDRSEAVERGASGRDAGEVRRYGAHGRGDALLRLTRRRCSTWLPSPGAPSVRSSWSRGVTR